MKKVKSFKLYTSRSSAEVGLSITGIGVLMLYVFIFALILNRII